ncbi:MAG: hypothetical protein KatS3mg068_1683 [Candidatus Sericytochromatia bacterium]|nr:MAG: hypothetical protein KatS3mg068_1683 [Candidatus Sericytochromatia bacterium]
MKNILAYIIFILVLSCSSVNETENVSDKFVRLYYQEMNQIEAIKIATMNAKEKLEKEIDLIKSRNSQFINDIPKISIKKEDVQIKDDIALVTYKIIIQPKNIKPFEKTAFISLYKENNNWKVSNFEEVQ